MRTTTALPGSVHHQLNMYALAATAAGVSMLALTPPSEAKIVYTKAHIVFHPHSHLQFKLDLNHDGVQDFHFANVYTASSGIGFYSGFFLPNLSTVNPLNMVRGHGYYFPSALPAGMKVGPRDAFIRSGYLARAVGRDQKVSFYEGDWANSGKGLQNRYLGVRFAIKNAIHYGWVRVSVSKWPFTATLTGYAYETIPGKAIITGATKGPDDAEPTAAFSSHSPEPATLGALALGAPGLSIWRRDEPVSAALEGI